MICGSRGSKSRLAKAAGAEPSGQMRDEKSHAAVARSTFRSQNVQNTPRSDHFWKLRCQKSARRCGAKHISKSKCTKNSSFGPLLEVEMSKKCTLLWREAHFQVKMYKAHQLWTTFGSWDIKKVHAVVARITFPSQNVKSTTCSDHFWKLRCRKRARRCGAKHISKSKCTKHTNFGPLVDFEVSFRVRGRRSTRDIIIRAVRRSGGWFPERGCILEHQIFRFAEMILHDRYSTSHDLASIFRGRRSTLDRWSGKIAKRSGTRPSTLRSTFHFWRKPRIIVSFLMLSTPKIEEVSQNCVVFDVVKFKIWGSLAELFCFWCCQVKNEEVSQNCCIFKLTDRQIDR